MAGDTKLRAIMMRDRKENPWLPYFLPNERYEVRFADIDLYGVSNRKCAPFSHAASEAGEGHRRRIAEWCERTVAGKWSLGMEALFFAEEDDAILCKITFS